MVDRNTARQLEEAAEKVRRRLSGKKQIYPAFQLPDRDIVEWEGDNIDDFLELCEHGNAGMAYICEYRAGQADADENEVFSKHIGELYQLEVAFLQDGYFHRFKKTADWWESYCESQEEEMFEEEQEAIVISEEQAAEIGARLSKLKAAEIAEEFIGKLGDTDHSNEAFDELLYEYVRNKYDWPKSQPTDLRRVNTEAYETLKNLSAVMEKKVVDSLLPVFIEWAGRNKLYKIPRADTELFLSERGLKLSKDSVLTLWRKGVLGMKEWQDKERKERQRALAQTAGMSKDHEKFSLDDD
jgi:hypothetical protein